MAAAQHDPDVPPLCVIHAVIGDQSAAQPKLVMLPEHSYFPGVQNVSTFLATVTLPQAKRCLPREITLLVVCQSHTH